ncbi:MAG: class I SAM-dependent methyltransferase [Thermoanaerobaculia bacterium]
MKAGGAHRGVEPGADDSPPSIDRFLGEPTRSIEDWRWLWSGDRTFPIRSHRGVLGHIVVLWKRLIRPFVHGPQRDLWDRQRVFNLVLLEYLQRGEDLRKQVTEVHEHRINHLDAVYREGLNEVMQHNDALFARVDQKLDFLRRETRTIWGRLGAALALAEKEGLPAVVKTQEEHVYLELERRFRGTEEEIAERISRFLPELEGRGEVLDLGCGRGEALAVLKARDIPARGVDLSASMVAECRRKGLKAEVGDLLEYLAAVPERKFGGIVSFHVIEHLPPEILDRLTRLAWRALRPGGVLILETPNPLSLVVAARNFWLDPTHRRPVHPESLKLSLELAGFEPVERIDLRPFPEAERLPEIRVDSVAPDQRTLAFEINSLRDRMDDLLFGCQDYALVANKPV